MRRAKQEALTIDTPSTLLVREMPLSYSGMDGSRFVLGDGVVIGLFPHTLSIQGDCHVKEDMELALMIPIPESGDYLYLVGARVASSSWNTFEVDLRHVPVPKQEAVRGLLEHVQATPSVSCQAWH